MTFLFFSIDSAEIRAARDGYIRTDLGFSYYDLPISLSDDGSPPMSQVQTVRIIVESRNDHDHFAGTKRVKGLCGSKVME